MLLLNLNFLQNQKELFYVDKSDELKPLSTPLKWQIGRLVLYLLISSQPFAPQPHHISQSWLLIPLINQYHKNQQW